MVQYLKSSKSYFYKLKKNGQDHRTDLQECCDFALESRDIKEIAREFPAEFLKYNKGITELLKVTDPKKKLAKMEAEIAEYRSWQQDVMNLIKTPADDRSIHWIWEETGGLGKSWLSRHIAAFHGGILMEGRYEDMAYDFNHHKAAIFDIPRRHGNLDHFYYMAEKLKDGMIFSSKYESRSKIFKSPHVIFFSNDPPPEGVWSEGKLKVWDMNYLTESGNI